MSFSDGLTLSDALANARQSYPNARRATPAEFDDLFAAAGITYDGTSKASDGFTVGPTTFISTGDNYDGGALRDLLGITTGGATRWTQIWTNPTPIAFPTVPRAFLRLEQTQAIIFRSDSIIPSPNVGWLLVATPEPSSAVVLLCAIVATIACNNRPRHS
jgi:hypothetical protein